MTRPSRRWLAAAAIGAWVAVQVFVPAAALLRRAETGEAQAFGWQMYAAHPSPLRAYEVVTVDGTRERFAAADLFIRWRAELDADDVAVNHLCDAVAGATQVEVVLGSSVLRTVPCG